MSDEVIEAMIEEGKTVGLRLGEYDVQVMLRAALDQVSDEFPQDALNTLAEAASDD